MAFTSSSAFPRPPSIPPLPSHHLPHPRGQAQGKAWWTQDRSSEPGIQAAELHKGRSGRKGASCICSLERGYGACGEGPETQALKFSPPCPHSLLTKFIHAPSFYRAPAMHQGTIGKTTVNKTNKNSLPY